MTQTTSFNVVTVEKTADDKCSLCGDIVNPGATMCHTGHPLGALFHKPAYGKGHPIRLVEAEASGTKCLLCGGQVDECGICSSLRHQMGNLYPMTREHAPSLFG